MIERLKAKSIGKRAGGFARAEKLSPQRRSEIAREAALKRWGKTPNSIQTSLFDSEISKSNAPDYIIHKSEKPTKDSFELAQGTFKDTVIRVQSEKQWADFSNIDFTKNPLIVVGSLLRHPNLVRAGYEIFLDSVEYYLEDNKACRWHVLDYFRYDKKESLKNLGSLVLDNVHLEMDAAKHSVLQNNIHNDSLTRIVIVHGCDPLEFALSTIRHKPDYVFNVSIRAKALKTINL